MREALKANFRKPLSHASRASHTSHFAIAKAQSSMQMVWLNPARSFESKFQETIVPRVSRVPPRHRQSAKLLADGAAKSCAKLLADDVVKSSAKLRKPISRNHRPTRLARPTRPTSPSAKREALRNGFVCSVSWSTCRCCFRFSCQRSIVAVPLAP